MARLLDLPMRDVLREIAEHMPGHASVWDSVRRAFEERDEARALLSELREYVYQLPSGVDEDADEADESPEDVTAHIAGLMARRIRKALGEE